MKCEKIPVLTLAKQVRKTKYLSGNVFIEEEGKSAICEIGYPICDNREQSSFVER